MHRLLPAGCALALAGLILAQGTPPATNLGTPQTPGTRTPEQNPATVVTIPQPPPAATPSAPSPAIPVSPGTPAPGISFGAAPPPLISPNR